jgi:hypothetical protein
MKGDMERIRQAYGVPAKKGGRVSLLENDGKQWATGTITGSRDGKIRIRLDGSNFSQNYHPTYCLEYLPEGAK